MKKKLIDYLACPTCSGDLVLAAEGETDGIEILDGKLACVSCSKGFPILRGIPRFIDLGEIDPEKAAIAVSFGFEWQHFSQESELYAEQLVGWIDPVEPEFFKGKVVLDGGCGKGRHMTLAAAWGAAEVIGLDLSDAVEPAFAATRGSKNMHVVQADLCHPPFKRIFDYAYSVGVIDHTPDPIVAFRAVASKIKPGGLFSVWVYGAENNEWITSIISPVRERFTSRIHPRTLLHLTRLPTAIVYLVSKLIYGPLNRSNAGSAIAKHLFYNDYMNKFSKFNWKDQHLIVFDHLVAPKAAYLTEQEFRSWWDDIGATEATIGWHNKNSWRGTGRIAGEAE